MPMRHCLLLVLCFFWVMMASAQRRDELAIKATLQRQTEDWNAGRLEQFMVGYWNSDSLMFVGKSGVTYGYKATLENYRKGYPDTASMGKLTFQLLQLKPLGKEHYLVVGKWFLKRSVGDVGGHFSLIWKKIDGVWKIVADHSS